VPLIIIIACIFAVFVLCALVILVRVLRRSGRAYQGAAIQSNSDVERPRDSAEVAQPPPRSPPRFPPPERSQVEDMPEGPALWAQRTID